MDSPASPNYTDSSIERIQSEHRRRIVESWGIAPGSRVLEIGCGQGDLTMALAEAVGPDGFVTGIDVAPPTYGAPLTLGQATDLILEGPFRNRIMFHFDYDIRQADFPKNSFDVVAFAHSSWYFSSLDEVHETLVAARRLAPRLCFAEWDIEPRTFEQMAHLLAIIIQGQVESFRDSSEANIRTPFTRAKFLELLGTAGWTVESSSSIESRSMQDADWEIAACRSGLAEIASSLNFPEKAKAFLQAELDVLAAVSKDRGNTTLDTFTLTAN